MANKLNPLGIPMAYRIKTIQEAYKNGWLDISRNHYRRYKTAGGKKSYRNIIGKPKTKGGAK